MPQHRRHRPERSRARVIALAIVLVTAVGTPAAWAATAPLPAKIAMARVLGPIAPSRLPDQIEDPAPYEPATSCDYTAKPGVARFAALLQRFYRGTGSYGMVSSCQAEGMVSEHTEGRAWDWAVSALVPAQRAKEQALMAWLFATDAAGHRLANMRRLGIMYVIFNKRIAGAWDGSWRPYACSGITGCHQDHVHFSFSWNGAMGRTSFWTGTVWPVDYGPCPGNGQMFAAARIGVHDVPCSWSPLSPGTSLLADLRAARHLELRQGDSGGAVRAAQRVLGGLPTDGHFTARMADLLSDFQARRGLPRTGRLDPPTWAGLLAFTAGNGQTRPPKPSPTPSPSDSTSPTPADSTSPTPSDSTSPTPSDSPAASGQRPAALA